jgi:hypothetical protein
MIRWSDEMANDEDFIKLLEKETDLLKKLQTEVNEAVERADGKIERMQKGASKEDVFGSVPPKQPQK